jgi:peptide deformylase
MILPVISYGHTILRKKCEEVNQNINKYEQLIKDMWETLYCAKGAGLASPQVNRNLKLFLINSQLAFESLQEEQRKYYFTGDQGIKETFINATITRKSKKTWFDYEGCLSIPEISEEVERAWSIMIEYYDADFNKYQKQFSGYTARVIQHEYDHTQGILYIDYLSTLKKQLLKNKLRNISHGKVKVDYKMKFLK